MPFWTRKKKPHSETIEALRRVRKELETGTASVESDTWRIMANEHVLNCIADDIENKRISSEDVSLFQRYNEMMMNWKKDVLSTLEEGQKDESVGECSETISINAPVEKVWEFWRDMDVISQTLLNGSAGRIDETHFWLKRVDPERGDIWVETFEEIELTKPIHITTKKTKIEVQAAGMDASLQEVELEGTWVDYIDFIEISKTKSKLIFRATFVPSKPATDYGKVFLAMFTQTEIHPTMKEEIQHQLKKFKELIETR
ncbi:MAG: hypothetical protein OEY22_05555 [Candidatus Bathyarchaeota archaeon]|nr:hypothetical protein [Candidatus Bathyarchaeota archaeon]MDH5788891.1 hypothetical protein [Candidatus Bathyarchaeota archaeon]